MACRGQDGTGAHPSINNLSKKKEVCPICNGFGMVKTSTKVEAGFEYEFYKECECRKKPKVTNENPFEEGEENGIKNSAT